MSDLKPCMCCESNDIEIITYEEKYHTRKIAKCMNCGARGSVCDSKEEAIEAWNTRPAEDAKDKEIKRLKAALHSVLQNAEFWDNEDDSLAIIHRIAKEALGTDTNVPTNAPDTNVGKMEG